MRTKEGSSLSLPAKRKVKGVLVAQKFNVVSFFFHEIIIAVYSRLHYSYRKDETLQREAK